MEIFSIRKTIFLVLIWLFLNDYVSFHLAQNFSQFSQLPLPPQTVGPESIAFDNNGTGPYTGVGDGRILKYEGPNVGFTDFATTSPLRINLICDGTNLPLLQLICGRPLGLGFYNKTGELYIADANNGLLAVGPSGGLATRLVSRFNGIRFSFTNSFDINQETGVVYLVDSGAVFLTGNLAIIAKSGDTSGRLFKYDIATKQVTLLLSGLSGPSGVALSKDNSYVLISEFIGRKIRRYWLTGENANSSDVFANTEGNPDNIKRTVLGDFWVATVIMKQQLIPTTLSIGLKFNQLGQVLETLNATAQYSNGISEVQERNNGTLYIGSLDPNFIGVYQA